MEFAICDDNDQALLKATLFVTEYSDLHYAEDQIKIHTFSSSMDLLLALEHNRRFDIFLLDVIMPNINGIRLATEIRRKDCAAKIIFLTSSKEFAVDSYSVGASHYLLKPVQKDKLFCVLEKAFDDIFRQQDQHIIIKTKATLTKIFFHDLIYIEVLGRIVFFHQKNGITMESAYTLSQVEEILLKDPRFVKSHRSYIVNFDYVKSISQRGFMLLGGLIIPISRSIFKEVRQEYINYSFNTEDHQGEI